MTQRMALELPTAMAIHSGTFGSGHLVPLKYYQGVKTMSKTRNLASLLLIGAGFFASPAIAQRCGQERWSVKTGTDSGAAQVGVANPQPANISDLIVLPPPDPPPADARVNPTENTVFVVNATLTDYKFESGATGDSDYHLVLMDDQGNTMIAEIPSPSCVDPSSPFLTQITNARSQFDAQLTVSHSFQTANIPVQVTGVGFFDFFHNQHGVAPNVIEIHPVLDIQFNPAPAAGDFALSASTQAMHLHPNSSSSAVITATPLKGNVPPNVNFSISGLPPGVSSEVTPDANGKAKVVLSASSSVPNGTFPVIVSATTKGRVRFHTLNLHLSNAPETTEGEMWGHKMIKAASEEDLLAQTNKLGAQGWELVSVVHVSGSPAWRAFFRKASRH